MRRVLSPEGKSYSWDDRGSGYGRGEGIASIIMRPLEDAIISGDTIRAVIRQTAINQDGKTQTITSPSIQAQQDLIARCYHKAGLNPADTTFVEAHMTGTLAGDPVEAEAIGSVFSQGRHSQEPLFVGSVKPNIGHTEASSGLASVIKIVLALERRVIPLNIHFDIPNPRIDLKKWKMQIPLSTQTWPTNRLLRASINNFGYGGSNSHIILDAADQYLELQAQEAGLFPHCLKSHRTSRESRRWLFPFSAKDVNSLGAIIKNLVGYLNRNVNTEQDFLENIADTFTRRYSAFPWNCAVPARSVSELTRALEKKDFHTAKKPALPRIGFVFNGQGAQWYVMGRELIDMYPVYKEALTEADQFFKDAGASWSLLGKLQIKLSLLKSDTE